MAAVASKHGGLKLVLNGKKLERPVRRSYWMCLEGDSDGLSGSNLVNPEEERQSVHFFKT